MPPVELPARLPAQLPAAAAPAKPESPAALAAPASPTHETYGVETADVETASDGYAARFAGPVGELFLDVQARTTLALLAPWPPSPDTRVLDVGGGHAQLAAPLAAAGYRVTVAGSSTACRARLDRLLPAGSFEFRAADLLALPFADRSFDAVLCFRLLPHAERWRELVAELCRLARRAVVLDYPDRRSANVVAPRLFGWKRRLEKNTRPYRCFTRREVLGELARHGFGRPRLAPQFFVPMAAHRALGKALGSAAVSSTVERASGALGLTRAFGSPVIVRAERQGAAS
jgi:2-polyprenyl-3-methyl-5-hydroxy-6-metoxy-1,4-benzoquinol methylase